MEPCLPLPFALAPLVNCAQPVLDHATTATLRPDTRALPAGAYTLRTWYWAETAARQIAVMH